MNTNILEEIYKELVKLGLPYRTNINLQEIQNKDGIYLFRVVYENKYYILKYFLNEEYTREIKYYSILKELNIPTIQVFSYTDKALLLEDLERSQKYRLGVASDLSDIELAKALAAWYINLHNKGAKYISEKGSSFYRETDIITKENIDLIRCKSNTEENKVWDLILDNFDLILSKIKSLEETLTYNDFYWTNLALSKDKKEAIMFDYNFLGVGYRYSDIRNVCSSLSKEAGEVFIKEYGGIDETEKIIDEGISIIVNLIFAYKRPQFPKWAKESLDVVYSGELEETFKKILD